MVVSLLAVLLLTLGSPIQLYLAIASSSYRFVIPMLPLNMISAVIGSPGGVGLRLVSLPLVQLCTLIGQTSNLLSRSRHPYPIS